MKNTKNSTNTYLLLQVIDRKLPNITRGLTSSMIQQSNIQVMIHFQDANLSDEERDSEALRLISQLRDLDEIEAVGRVTETAPDGSKSGLGFLTGLLMAEVSVGNAKKLFGFLSDRLSGKTIELEVQGNGKELKVKASSREELQIAINAAEQFN
jgi:hypothetical protein